MNKRNCENVSKNAECKPKSEPSSNPLQLDNSWHERGELPPIGEQCEWKGLRGGKWVACEVIDKYQDKEMVVFNTGEYRNCKFEILQLDCVEFRPIKSERERFGLYLYRAVNYNSSDYSDEQILHLTRFEDYCKPFDAGFRAPE